MDINNLRIATTIVSLVVFLAITAWAWSRRRRAGFEEAARLPFLDTVGGADAAGEQR